MQEVPKKPSFKFRELLKRLIWFATGWAVLLFGIFVTSSFDDKLTWSTWSYERISFLILMMSITAYWAMWFMIPLLRHILGKEKVK